MNTIGKLGTPANRALSAYSAPIKQHAAQWSAGIIDSIQCDLDAGASVSFAADLALVDPVAEWYDARSNWRLDVPDGAIDWACDVWTRMFTHELERLAKVRAANGAAVIVEHLRSTGASQ